MAAWGNSPSEQNVNASAGGGGGGAPPRASAPGAPSFGRSASVMSTSHTPATAARASIPAGPGLGPSPGGIMKEGSAYATPAPGGGPVGARVYGNLSVGGSNPGGGGAGQTQGGGGGGGGNPSYDVIHLSARNARLEEKLSKALAKNRSMAKYYDQLLAKTRDAQERELEDLKAENRRLINEAARAQGMQEQLARERSEREALSQELHAIRSSTAAADAKRTEEYATTQSMVAAAHERLAASQAECAHLKAQLQGAQAAAASPAAMGVDMGSHTVTQMQKLLDAAREERNHERAQAQARDAEMARQLSDIREQALDRIRESTGAAREVAALKERLHAAEAERNRLRDECDEFRADEEERRELRRRMNVAEETSAKLKQKAERCDLAEAKLRAADADRQNLQAERADAHKRLQEMTEKLLEVTAEKDVLVRHSAHQVHVEAELANAKRELEQMKRGHLAVRTDLREHTSEWREASEGVGRVLRHHIYSHTRWERRAADELNGAAEAHALGQRSTVRLVAAAEREAAELAANAIEVIRASRQLLQQHASECAAVVAELAHRHQARADDRIEAALGYVREAEARADVAEAEAERHAADARRARAAVDRAASFGGKDSNFATQSQSTIGASNAQITRKLRLTQFQLFGLAMWKKATVADRAEGADLLQSQLLLARREAAVAVSRAENWERQATRKGADVRWSLMAAALLRRRDAQQREEMDDVTYALTQKTLQLQLAVKERAAAAETLNARESELYHVRGLLAGLRREHAAALRQLQQEHGLRREISDMVKHEGMATEPTVSEVQAALADLADHARRAADLARTAGDAAEARAEADAMGRTLDQPEGTRADGDVDDDVEPGLALLRDRARVAAAQKESAASEGPSAEAALGADLEACRDAMLIMDDEDTQRAMLEEAEKKSAAGGATRSRLAQSDAAPKKLTEFEQATRKTRRFALEVKAAMLAALVSEVEHRRVAAKLKHEKADAESQISAMRAAAVASKFKRAVGKSKEIRAESKKMAQSRWSSLSGGGLSALKRAVQQDTAAAENTPSPPQRQSGNVFNRMTTVDESDMGMARKPPSAGIVVRGGGRGDNTAGGHPTSFSAMMRASKARAAATGGGNAGRDATLGGKFGAWDSSPPAAGPRRARSTLQRR